MLSFTTEYARASTAPMVIVSDKEHLYFAAKAVAQTPQISPKNIMRFVQSFKQFNLCGTIS